MKTDKELLELAALAAKYPYKYWDGNSGHWPTPGFCIIDSSGTPANERRWNPLTDDGDALRLASKMKLTVEFGNNAVVHPCEIGGDGTDPLVATRRAIVRAAAAVGEQME